jgi:hypothetical protein
MLLRETVAVYCENHTDHTDILCGQNAEFWYSKAGRYIRYSNYWALKGQTNLFKTSRHFRLTMSFRSIFKINANLRGVGGIVAGMISFFFSKNVFSANRTVLAAL